MKKIVVESCDKCPYYKDRGFRVDTNTGYGICKEIDNTVTWNPRFRPISDFCELPDAEDEE